MRAKIERTLIQKLRIILLLFVVWFLTLIGYWYVGLVVIGGYIIGSGVKIYKIKEEGRYKWQKEKK